MATTTEIRDICPRISPAGKGTTVCEEDCLSRGGLGWTHDVARPATPTNLRKYRRNNDPGAIHKHFGLADDSLPNSSEPYGIKCARAVYGNTSQILRADENNARTKALTKNPRKTIQTPPENDQRFGIKQTPTETDLAKQCIWPRSCVLLTDKRRDSAVGQAVSRNYDWPVDPAQTTFGHPKSVGSDHRGAKHAMTDATQNETRLEGKVVSDCRKMKYGELGRSRGLTEYNLPVSRGYRFGIPSEKGTETAGDCIRGYYSVQEQQPDKLLGTCSWRKQCEAPECDSGRVFGVPSIRADIREPAKRSLADVCNYGDEVGAGAVLSPQKYENIGLSDAHFMVPRPVEEVRRLMVNKMCSEELVDRAIQRLTQQEHNHGSQQHIGEQKVSLAQCLRLYEEFCWRQEDSGSCIIAR
eukprot:GHVQ01035006.1.p1 GENE.GHVQ01035006.1~~GHVQ01035006.1.p1  ORF type:complete len:412 (+),score=51.47 GHVQ01035006.1:132-1367(+)